MLLKIGELAQRCGMTVRALHHYDDIALLKPSARSPAGYRLYSEADVARLDAVQALQQLGFSLAQIRDMLAGDGDALSTIVTHRLHALDREIAQARRLRSQLALLRTAAGSGVSGNSADWGATLALMDAYSRHFTAAELQGLLRRWARVQADWMPLIAEVRDAFARGVPAEDIEAQRLAARWMRYSMRWMRGSIDMAVRWGEMHAREPGLIDHAGLDLATIRYMGAAIDLRLAALRRHLSWDDIGRLNKRLERSWNRLAARANSLMTAGTDPCDEAARHLLAEWDALIDRTVDHDPVIRTKFLAAYRSEPLLQVDHMVEPGVRDYLARVHEARHR